MPDIGNSANNDFLTHRGQIQVQRFKNISFQLFNFQVFSTEQANASASATRPNGMIWTNAYLVGLMSRIIKSEHSLGLSQVSAKAKCQYFYLSSCL